jgi:hypothetical protein
MRIVEFILKGLSVFNIHNGKIPMDSPEGLGIGKRHTFMYARSPRSVALICGAVPRATECAGVRRWVLPRIPID